MTHRTKNIHTLSQLSQNKFGLKKRLSVNNGAADVSPIGKIPIFLHMPLIKLLTMGILAQ
jgi:hypothetical protein